MVKGPWVMRLMFKQAIVAAALLLGGGVSAQVAGPVAPQVYRLSPEEVLRLQMATADRPSDIDASQFLRPRDGRVHGEVGVGIGTGGYRSVYGAMGVPLGETGSASFAFESTQFDDSLRYGNRLRGGRVPNR